MLLLTTEPGYSQKKLSPTKVEFVGFSMRRPLPDTFKPALQSGLEFELKVTVQDKKRVLGINFEKARINVFQDQLGVNLQPDGAWIKDTKVSADRTEVYVKIGTPIVPKKGSRFFKFDATAPLYTGSTILNLELKNLDLTKATAYESEKDRVQKVNVFRAGIFTRLEVLASFLPEQIASMQFKNQNNVVIVSEKLEVKPGANDKENWFIYKLKTDSSRISMHINYFGEVLKQHIPIKMKVPLWF